MGRERKEEGGRGEWEETGEKERKRLIIKAKYLNPKREYGFSSAECSFPVYTPLENKRSYTVSFLL